jgi:hypothetical protein
MHVVCVVFEECLDIGRFGVAALRFAVLCVAVCARFLGTVGIALAISGRRI